MKRTYHCPHCEGLLNPDVKIILRAEYQGRTGLILFSPQPGNYDALVPEELRLPKKATVRFGCPICGKELTSPRDRTMAEILFTTSTGQDGRVVFSRVFGHHATYFITDEEVRTYGEPVDDDTVNFWGLGRER